MTASHDDFIGSLDASTPPETLSTALASLWWAHRGEWAKAHETIQDEAGAGAAWVHAFLHRQEGDMSNAAYWYRRAQRPTATGSLDAEWREIAVWLCSEA